MLYSSIYAIQVNSLEGRKKITQDTLIQISQCSTFPFPQIFMLWVKPCFALQFLHTISTAINTHIFKSHAMVLH